MIIQIVGYKNSGKTTLICRLVSLLSRKGVKVGTIKHDSHDEFDIDMPGTDSWKHREAGARVTAVTSLRRTAVIEEKPADLQQLLMRMDGMDMVLVEGFKQESYPKIVMIRTEEDVRLLDELEHVIAAVSWIPSEGIGNVNIQIFGINEADKVLAFIEAH